MSAVLKDRIRAALARALVQHRACSGLTQANLAADLGIRQSYLSKIENAEKGVTLELLCQIADVTGIPASALLGEPAWTPAPEGLRALAADAERVRHLAISPQEWRSLKSLQADPPLDADGYVQILLALRSAQGGQ